MGELHLDIIIDRLRREFKVECNQGRPQVTYKEAITKPVELREVFKKQSGGRGKFADIICRVEPVDEGFEGNLQFIDEVKGGDIPKEFIPSIQKGFLAAMKNGVLAGYPVEQLKVTVISGSFHPVDSDQLSFELCAQQAFKKACRFYGLKRRRQESQPRHSGTYHEGRSCYSRRKHGRRDWRYEQASWPS